MQVALVVQREKVTTATVLVASLVLKSGADERE